MSQETMEWLNGGNILVGQKEKNRVWWYDSDLLAGLAESPFYEGFIPVDDVNRRLFSFSVNSESMYLATPDGFVEIPGRQALVRSDNGAVLGVFKESYQGHSYSEWLLDTLAALVDSEIGITSAGLLRGGAQAWVNISVPDHFTTPEGVEYRPNILSATSFDGTLATTFGKTITLAICDNTRDMALSEMGEQRVKIKHSRWSTQGFKLQTARETLGLIHTMADDFAAEVAALTSITVTDKQWNKFLNELAPAPADDDNKRGNTVAAKKRDTLTALYRNDPRCAQWVDTAYGALQAFNTYNLHETQIRKGAHRAERIMENTLSGKIGQSDNAAAKALAKALGRKTLITA